jgi:hypothetical protein
MWFYVIFFSPLTTNVYVLDPAAVAQSDVVTCYGSEGPRFEPQRRGASFCAHGHKGPRPTPTSCKMGPLFAGDKVAGAWPKPLTTHPHLVARLKKQ